MGLKKGRRVRKGEVPRDTPTEFELGNMVQTYSRGGRRGRQEKGRKSHRNRGSKPGAGGG